MGPIRNEPPLVVALDVGSSSIRARALGHMPSLRRMGITATFRPDAKRGEIYRAALERYEKVCKLWDATP